MPSPSEPEATPSPSERIHAPVSLASATKPNLPEPDRAREWLETMT